MNIDTQAKTLVLLYEPIVEKLRQLDHDLEEAIRRIKIKAAVNKLLAAKHQSQLQIDLEYISVTLKNRIKEQEVWVKEISPPSISEGILLQKNRSYRISEEQDEAEKLNESSARQNII